MSERGRDWWLNHRFSEEYRQFVGRESEASTISGYHALFVPGLLQTEDYARALTAQVIGRGPDDEEVAARVGLRLSRQQQLAERAAGATPPALVMAVDEAVLRRPVGGPDVLRRQLDHLLETADRGALELIVVPLELAGHPGLGGTFELLEFAGGADALVLVESARTDFLIHAADLIAGYRATIEILRERGLTGEAAVGALTRIREQ